MHKLLMPLLAAALLGAVVLPGVASAADIAHVGVDVTQDELVTWNRDNLKKFWGDYGYFKAPNGVSFTPPEMHWLNEDGDTPTGCGLLHAGDALDTGNFYCQNDKTIWLDAAAMRRNNDRWGAPGAVATMAHEYGHHIENLLGMIPSGTPSRSVDKKNELAADCLAGAFMHSVQKGSVQGGTLDRWVDLTTLMDRFYAIGDTPPPPGYEYEHPHGTGFERQAAFSKGWDWTNTPMSCTTYPF